jgi:hypothetical protein
MKTYDECQYAAKTLELVRWRPFLGDTTKPTSCQWHGSMNKSHVIRKPGNYPDSRARYDAAGLWWGSRTDGKTDTTSSYICRTKVPSVPAFPLATTATLANDYYGVWKAFDEKEMPNFYTKQELATLNKVPGWWGNADASLHGQCNRPNDHINSATDLDFPMW